MVKQKTLNSKKTVMTNKGEKSNEEAAKKWRTPRSPIETKEVRRTPENVRNKRRGDSKVYEGNQEQGSQETSKESQGRSYCEVQHDARKEETENKAFDGVVCQWQIHG